MMLRTVAILRGYDPDVAADLAARCWHAGIDLVEVPVQGEVGWLSLEAVLRRADGRPVGAGTVLTLEEVERAVGLGASVIISPGIDEEIIRVSQERKVLPLPGVMTASDVSLASRWGLKVCKLFPASLVGSAWLDAMRGPFPAMTYVAVGGISTHNASEYLDCGASGVAFGSSIETLLSLEDPQGFVSTLHAQAGQYLMED
jgi:Entner-Doudoroff aldolase